MDITVFQIGDVAVKLSELLTPFIMASFTYMLTIWLKDYLSRISKGVLLILFLELKSQMVIILGDMFQMKQSIL